MRWWMLFVLAGCGRVSFDPLATDAPWPDGPVLPLCFEDDFDDGDASDWSQDEGPWTILPAGGPDGSPAWTNTFGTFSRTSHTMLHGVTEAHLAFDFYGLDQLNGDFILRIGGMGLEMADPHYATALYVADGDTEPDEILTSQPVVQLATHATTFIGRTWTHFELRLGADHAMQIELDGAPYMASPADATYSGPFDVGIVFWGGGRVDNISLRCVR